MVKPIFKIFTPLIIILVLGCKQNHSEPDSTEEKVNFESFYKVDSNGYFFENIELKVNYEFRKNLNSITSNIPYSDLYDSVMTYYSDGSFSYKTYIGSEEENGITTHKIDYAKGTYSFDYDENYMKRTVTHIKTSEDNDFVQQTTPIISNNYVAIYENHILDSFNYEGALVTLHPNGLSYRSDNSYKYKNEMTTCEMNGVITLTNTNYIMNIDFYMVKNGERLKHSTLYKNMELTPSEHTFSSTIGKVIVYNGINKTSYLTNIDGSKSEDPTNYNGNHLVYVLETENFIFTQIMFFATISSEG